MARKKATQKASTPREVRCYHCGHRFEVSARAMTGSCPGCYGSLMLDDLVIKNTQSYRKLQTCGKIHIQARGRVIADLVDAAEGITVTGKLEAKAYRGGPVSIGPRALWKANCAAPSLEVAPGGKVERSWFVIPCDPYSEEIPKAPEEEKPAPVDTGPKIKVARTRGVRPRGA